MLEPLSILILTYIASTTGAITGFGSSTIMVPVLSLFLPVPMVLLFVGIIHLSGNIWKSLLFRRGIIWGLVLGFGISGLIGSWIGASFSLETSSGRAREILGIFLIGYVFFLFFRPRWKLPQREITTIGGGLLAGISAGFFGMGGAIRSAFLAAFDLPKETYIFTSALIALCIDVTRISTYIAGGISISHWLFLTLILCIPISLGGTYTGKKILDKIPQGIFRKIVGCSLGIIGFILILYPQLP